MRRATSRLLLPGAAASCLFGLLAASPARGADADEKEQCINASDQGQQLRDDGKYRLAREAFLRCSRSTCPGLVSHNCAQWLIDVDGRSPTVVIDAKDENGNDLVDVKVTSDGTELVAKLNGMPFPIDPGEHALRYETSGYPPIEEHIVIRTGEKNRVLKVRFAQEKAPAPPPAAPTPAPEASEASRGIPLPVWIFGGVAVAAFASEAYFGLSGMSQFNGDNSGDGKCAPHCGQAEVSSVQTKFLAADVSLGVGLVSAGLATYFFLRPRESKPAPEAAIEFAPRTGGGVATVRGHF